MAPVVRKVTKRIFIITNIIIVIFFLLSCANMFLEPARWWFLAILGLAFPFLLFLLIGFLVLWICFRSKWALLPIGALIIGATNIRALAAFHFTSSFQQQKKEGAIRILSWNVKWFDGQRKEHPQDKSHRSEMLAFIQKQDADILCFQEFMEPYLPGFSSNVGDVVKLNYPYYYRVVDYGRFSTLQTGVAIFSRFPIVNTVHVQYPGSPSSRAAESLIACDFDIHGQKIRVFTTHLQSVLLDRKDYHDLQIIKNADDSMMEASRSVVRKLKKGYQQRSTQADLVRKTLDESPFPEVICGDFNDVPNSYTYFCIRGSRKDAFIEKDKGLGRTFSGISPTLRIDYILPDKQFDVLQYKRTLVPYSDHYPIIADLMLK